MLGIILRASYNWSKLCHPFHTVSHLFSLSAWSLDRFGCRYFHSETPLWRGKPGMLRHAAFDCDAQEGTCLPSCASQPSARVSAIAE